MDKTLYALQLLGRRTTDNAAARNASDDATMDSAAIGRDSMYSDGSPTQAHSGQCSVPAAPTLTPTGNSPWTDREAFHAQYGNLAYVSADFARRLEALVHRQHEAFRKIDALLFDTDGTGFVALEADQREQAMRLCDELRDTYAALEQEIERE